METQNTPKTVIAVNACCGRQHRPRYRDQWLAKALASISVESHIRGRIMYCETQSHRPNIARATDKLRDHLTVRLLTADLEALGVKS